MSYSIGIVCSRGIGPDRGGRARNEDNYLVCRDGSVTWLEDGNEKREAAGGTGTLIAVCDGMGGHDDGHVAATAAVRVLAKLYRPGVPRSPAKALLKYLQDSHRRLYDRARESGPVTMGTTATVVWILNGFAHWAHVGDSRLYLYRDGRIDSVTRDHTRNEFLQRDGHAPVADGLHLAQNFIYGSRGLGDNTSLRLDEGLDCGSIAMRAGDRLLLATDGVFGFVDETSLADVLRNTPAAQSAAVACMERAVARGSNDNLTAVVVVVDQPSHDQGPVIEDEDQDDSTLLY